MKKIVSLLISLIPVNVLRIFFLRIFCGYQIDSNSKVGMFNILIADKLTMVNATIGSFNYIDAKTVSIQNGLINKLNRIKHINQLVLKERSIIFSKNFIGGSRHIENRADQNLILGKCSEILRNNYFDVTDEITVGNNVVFGGNGSEIWTHGFDTNRKMLRGGVVFKNDIFIGSKCIFTKGIEIGDNITIGPGSVVYKSVSESGLYSSQQLIKIK
jgi:acetyltransferase-like isoleucine patch superfamily enzyme